MRIASGVTDQYIYFDGGSTGLTGFTVYRSRNGGTATAMTTPTINETDSTNMPGTYELLLDEDMTIDSGDYTQEMVFHIAAAGMSPVKRTIELFNPALIVDDVWDEDISEHLGGNNAGQYLTSTLIDTGTTLPAILGTPAGADLATDVAAVKTDTAGIKTKTDSLAFTSGNVDANIVKVAGGGDITSSGTGGQGYGE